MLNSIPFFKTTLIGLCLWIALIGASGWIFQAVKEKDQSAYLRLMEQTDIERAESAMTYKAQQTRFNVHKHFLFVKNHQRLQACLRSRSSELVISQQGHQGEMVEHFKQMTCQMQEALVYVDPHIKENKASSTIAKQYVRYVEADEASYHYDTQQLFAQQALLSRYILAGHDLVSSFKQFNPFMKGKASSVELILNSEQPAFKARGFEGFWHSEDSFL